MASPMLPDLLSEKALQQRVDPTLTSYCPTMDLIALGTVDQQIMIYRLNGQRVFAPPHKANAPQIERLCWKPSGQLLATASSDGMVRLISAESTKVVHQLSAGNQDVSHITCLGWASNRTSRKNASAISKAGPEGWEEFLVADSTINERTPFDLPSDLTLIDIETSLPKLSVLAAGGGLDDVFSSRSSLDALFRPFDPKDNNIVDVMVVGTKEGNIHLSVYDSFEVGTFSQPIQVEGNPAQLVLHASHERYSTHALLVRSLSSAENLSLVPMDLRFISTSRSQLSLLASRSTALQNLLRYINQVQSLMVNEWKSTQELPGKFIRNINEKLGENGTHDIVQALYHSVATGHTFPAVREWLVDELQERGHKRWDKAVTTGLENIRRLVHENMLPALDRCSVILSRLDGIAKFQAPSETVGYSSHQIARITDTVASLHLVSSKILAQAVDELDFFTAFSTWLRHEIDRLASESASDETADKETFIDHSKVLLYLQTAMTSSSLETYLGQASVEDYNRDGWKQVEQGAVLFELLDKQIQKQEQGLPYIKALPRVELLYTYLNRQCTAIFSQIAASEKRNVRFGTAEFIGQTSIDTPMDITMSALTSSSCSAYVALVPKNTSNQVQMIQAKISIENGISSLTTVASCIVHLGVGRVKDIKFLSETTLLVLWEAGNTTHLLRIPFMIGKLPGRFGMEYARFSPSSEPRNSLHLSNDEVLSTFDRFDLGAQNTFIPELMQVRKQHFPVSGTARIILFEKDRLRYRVYRIPDMHDKEATYDRDVTMR